MIEIKAASSGWQRQGVGRVPVKSTWCSGRGKCLSGTSGLLSTRLKGESEGRVFQAWEEQEGVLEAEQVRAVSENCGLSWRGWSPGHESREMREAAWPPGGIPWGVEASLRLGSGKAGGKWLGGEEQATGHREAKGKSWGWREVPWVGLRGSAGPHVLGSGFRHVRSRVLALPLLAGSCLASLNFGFPLCKEQPPGVIVDSSCEPRAFHFSPSI